MASVVVPSSGGFSELGDAPEPVRPHTPVERIPEAPKAPAAPTPYDPALYGHRDYTGRVLVDPTKKANV